jgi:NADPH-dependent 2,4-dienoyl-CoA reductase/sulfur reductase-like enzyme
MAAAYDLVVVGAGPAGLSAATEAAGLGLATLLLDEQPGPGGQIYRKIEDTRPVRLAALGRDYAAGGPLAAAFRASASSYEPGATVFDITSERWIGFEQEGTAHFVEARRIVLATGAIERPFPIPGWTLPGVMTAGAAQILLKSAGLVPDARTVIAGSGPLLYLLASQLLKAGAAITALLDTTDGANLLPALRHLPGALRHPRDLGKGLRLLADLRRPGLRHVRGVTALAAEGGEALSGVVFRSRRGEERLPADLLLLHQGVVPNIQITQALRCDHTWDPLQLSWKPVVDAWGETSFDGLFVAGEGAGIVGANASALQGRIAALQAAFGLGRLDEKGRDARAAPIAAALRRESGMRRFLDTLYRPALPFRVPQGEATLVCRCEEVTMGEVREAVALGCTGPNQLKAFVRAGMGPCQGRLCGLTVCEAIAQERRESPADIGYFRLRPPFKPVTLGALADMKPPSETAMSSKS